MSNIIWSGGETLGSKCVVGLDRDGVINVDLGTYVTHPDSFKPIPGSLEAIAELRRKGYKIAIITDQGGIEKGIMTMEDVDNVHNRMFEMLGEAGCYSIDALYYSASSRKEDPYAKPNTGMFKRCEAENPHIRFKGGYYVGDKMKDLKVALKVGATPVLVRTGYGLTTEQELNRYANREVKQKVLIFDDLAQFIKSLE